MITEKRLWHLFDAAAFFIRSTSKNSPFGLGANLSPHKCLMKKPQYTKYSVFSITFSGTKSSAPSDKKEFSEDAIILEVKI